MMRAPAPESSGAPPAGGARPAGGRAGIAAEFARLLRAAADLENASETTALDAMFAPLPLEQVAPEQPADGEELSLLPELTDDAAGEQAALEEAAAASDQAASNEAEQPRLLRPEPELRIERSSAATSRADEVGREQTLQSETERPAAEPEIGAPAPRPARSTAPAGETTRESNAERIGMAAGDPTGEAAAQRLAAEADARTGRDANDRSRDAASQRALPSLDPLAEASGARPAASASAQSGPRDTSALESRIVPEIPARNEHELLHRVRLLADNSGGQARIQLQPPQLGGLDVKLTVSERFVQLDLVADRMPVAELFGRHLPELQSALEAHGLRIDRANIEFRDRDLSQQQSSSERGQGGPAEERANGGERREDPHQAHDRMLRAALHGSLGAVDVRV